MKTFFIINSIAVSLLLIVIIFEIHNKQPYIFENTDVRGQKINKILPITFLVYLSGGDFETLTFQNALN